MISNKVTPNIDLFARIEPSKYTDMGTHSFRFKSIEQPETPDFKTVFTGLVENLNQDIKKPDQLLQDYMTGVGNVDVHDIMIAVNKTEAAAQLATSVTTKIINVYDKIMQINI